MLNRGEQAQKGFRPKCEMEIYEIVWDFFRILIFWDSLCFF